MECERQGDRKTMSGKNGQKLVSGKDQWRYIIPYIKFFIIPDTAEPKALALRTHTETGQIIHYFLQRRRPEHKLLQYQHFLGGGYDCMSDGYPKA